MNHILLAAPDRDLFDEMIQIFEKQGVSTTHTASGEAALAQLATVAGPLLVCSDALPDMSGRQLVERAVMQNPMINCVVSSSQDAKQFHETYEGLGVLMQFPEKPGPENVQTLMDHLARIHSLSNQST